MYILRLNPPHLSKAQYHDVEKYHKIVKRIQALNLSLPQSDRTLYYTSEYQAMAQTFAEVLGNIELRPMFDYGLNPTEALRVILDAPVKLSRSLESQTGVSINFKSPMAVLTKVNPNNQEEFQWASPASDWIFFAYPDEMVIPSRKDSGISLQQLMLPQIEKGSFRIFKNLKTFNKFPEEVESVHQYRVALRSFRALISFTKPLLPEAAYQQLQALFREKAQETSHLRELDVLIEDWQNVRDEEQEYLVQSLREQRIQEAENLVFKLNNSQTDNELQAGINQFIYLLSLTDWHQQDGLEYLDNRLHRWYRYTLEAFWQMNQFDFQTVHKIRLKSKKYRYISEYFEEVMTETQLNLYKKAKKRQADLGDICDAIRNQEAVQELMGAFDDNSLKEAQIFTAKEKEREDRLLTKLELKESNHQGSISGRVVAIKDQTPSEGNKQPEQFYVKSKDLDLQANADVKTDDEIYLTEPESMSEIEETPSQTIGVERQNEIVHHEGENLESVDDIECEEVISLVSEQEDIQTPTSSSTWKWLLVLFIIGMVIFYMSL